MEVLIQHSGRWYVARLGLCTNPQEGFDPLPVWCEQDGEVICAIGEQQRLVDLNNL